ncbi:hypothetical protein KY285_007142 [Solanum tuberosum]|nr:hypothetical protein KY285_007142 [Solanum tuberosum]
MDNESSNQNFHGYIETEIWDRKFKETSEFLEMESMDHEFEEVDQLAFSQICQSYEYALLDFEKSKERISKDLENEVMDNEIEKVDELAFSQICKSLENEVLETNKMHISALIQSLEDEGMVDSQFRFIYLLKKNETPSFFMNRVYIYFKDARAIILNLTTTLESSTFVDFDLLKMHCFKLKASSACIGACILQNGVSILIEAADKKSKNECLVAVRNLTQVYNDLHSKFESFMELEMEIALAEEKALRLKSFRLEDGKSNKGQCMNFVSRISHESGE